MFQLIFDHVIRPAANLVSESVTVPDPKSENPVFRCTVPWAGADQSSMVAEAIECSVTQDLTVS